MNICMYCLEEIKVQHAKEHVFPACVGGDVCLPDGYVCDKCNSYFSKMDKAILLNNYIATTIAIEEIPNRYGRIREKISDRIICLKNRQFAMVLEPVSLLGQKSVTMKITPSKEFDELIFARAIHKIAFNSFAYEYGNRALSNRYNKIRNYIRKAKQGELWTYVVTPEPHLELAYKFTQTKSGMLAQVRVLCLDFVVSLEGWRPEFEYSIPKRDNIFIIREVGQWQASNFLGLMKN